MSNLFSNLYQWPHRQVENFVTETFAFVLPRLVEAEPKLGKRFVVSRFRCLLFSRFPFLGMKT